jgi:hypothetical protein
MEYIIKGIPCEGVETVWRFAEPFIKRALDHTFGEISAMDILQFCENRDMQLWMIVKGNRVVGAGTTQIVFYPQMKVCRIVTLAGTEFDNWMGMAHAYIEAWAISQQCQDMEVYVRKGFMPKLQDIGYKHRYSVAHKRIRE